jgi:hypothetical protein
MVSYALSIWNLTSKLADKLATFRSRPLNVPGFRLFPQQPHLRGWKAPRPIAVEHCAELDPEKTSGAFFEGRSPLVLQLRLRLAVRCSLQLPRHHLPQNRILLDRLREIFAEWD